MHSCSFFFFFHFQSTRALNFSSSCLYFWRFKIIGLSPPPVRGTETRTSASCMLNYIHGGSPSPWAVFFVLPVIRCNDQRRVLFSFSARSNPCSLALVPCPLQLIPCTSVIRLQGCMTEPSDGWLSPACFFSWVLQLNCWAPTGHPALFNILLQSLNLVWGRLSIYLKENWGVFLVET